MLSSKKSRCPDIRTSRLLIERKKHHDISYSFCIGKTRPVDFILGLVKANNKL